jgi:hypothetical protein
MVLCGGNGDRKGKAGRYSNPGALALARTVLPPDQLGTRKSLLHVDPAVRSGVLAGVGGGGKVFAIIYPLYSCLAYYELVSTVKPSCFRDCRRMMKVSKQLGLDHRTQTDRLF